MDDNGLTNSTAKDNRQVIDLDTGMVLTTDDYDDDDEEEEDTNDNEQDPNASYDLSLPPRVTTIPEMKEFLYSVDHVFLDSLTPEELEAVDGGGDVAHSSSSLALILEKDVDSKTQDIVSLLQEDTLLEATFSRLTDQVEYKDFWIRYFVRLDQEESITRTYEIYYPKQIQLLQQQHQQLQDDNEATRRRGHEMDTAGKALKSVTSFLGGAVKRLIQEEQIEDDIDDIQHDNKNEKGKSAVGGGGPLSFFQVSGRPPFVLNTAVSDVDGEVEDEEDDDQLGWDDDDDDDDDDDGNIGAQNDEDRDGQIEFKDAEKERLQEELEQAMAERDMLHKTVEMQTEELKKLKEGVASRDESKQVDALKMSIFEKDSELAALRARLQDDQDRTEADHGNEEELVTLRRETEELKTRLSARDSEITRLEKQIEAAADKADVSTDGDGRDDRFAELQEQLENALSESTSHKSALDALTGVKESLLEQLDSMKSAMERVLAESNALRKAQLDSGNESAAQLAAVQKELLVTKSELERLTSENQHLHKEIEESKATLSSVQAMQKSTQAAVDAKEKELTEVQTLLEEAMSQVESKRTESANTIIATSHAMRPSSPGSSSTGVRVPSPVIDPEPIPPRDDELAPKSDDDDASDWGDW